MSQQSSISWGKEEEKGDEIRDYYNKIEKKKYHGFENALWHCRGRGQSQSWRRPMRTRVRCGWVDLSRICLEFLSVVRNSSFRDLQANFLSVLIKKGTQSICILRALGKTRLYLVNGCTKKKQPSRVIKERRESGAGHHEKWNHINTSSSITYYSVSPNKTLTIKVI